MTPKNGNAKPSFFIVRDTRFDEAYRLFHCRRGELGLDAEYGVWKCAGNRKTQLDFWLPRDFDVIFRNITLSPGEIVEIARPELVAVGPVEKG